MVSPYFIVTSRFALRACSTIKPEWMRAQIYDYSPYKWLDIDIPARPFSYLYCLHI
jgi:hypothetical protein